MLSYIWPLALVVFSNVVYQICARSVPDDMHPLASLTVTYLVGAIISFVLYCVLEKQPDILREYRRLNWAPFGLGLIIVGLEVGYIYAYKAGWPISTAQVLQAGLVAIFLVFIGVCAYRETLSLKRLLGIVISLIGLILIQLG